METANTETTPTSGAALLDDVAGFIRKYLACDDHQLTILTLWSACARQCYGFRSAPYLDIRSPEPHCGKSICLFLLNSLAGPSTIFYTGVAPLALMRRIAVGRTFKELEDENASDKRVMTLLLDDCHHTFGPSERQPLLGLINSGSDSSNYYPVGDAENYFFGPKAFAGNAPLPRSLVSRCIPVVLRRPRPTEKTARLHHSPVIDAGDALGKRLKQWLELEFPRLSEAADEEPSDVPVTLSPGQRQCAEPLVHIADLAGGAWPAKIRAAWLPSSIPRMAARNCKCSGTFAPSSVIRTIPNTSPPAICSLNFARRTAVHGVNGAPNLENALPHGSVPSAFSATACTLIPRTTSWAIF